MSAHFCPYCYQWTPPTSTIQAHNATLTHVANKARRDALDSLYKAIARMHEDVTRDEILLLIEDRMQRTVP